MKSLKKDQNGLAAIIVTVFILLVLTLVVLAFSQITRREQQQGLDRQLVTDAFVAAESGINLATKYIRTDNPSDGIDLEKKECVKGTPASHPLNPENMKLETKNIFKPSCVLFDRHPQTLEYSAIDTDTQNGEIISLKTESNNLSDLTITWHANDGGGDYTGCPGSPDAPFPPDKTYPTNCGAGIIRVLLMPFTDGVSREDLTKNSYTVYLRPTAPATPGSGITPFQRHNGPDQASNQGKVIAATCPINTAPEPRRCTATITGVPGGNGLFMYIRSIYKDSVVSISGTNGPPGVPVRFTEAQAMIDSTGKANDVLKRLQVRIPLVEKYNIPAYVLESLDGICKQLDVQPNAPATSKCGGLDYFK